MLPSALEQFSRLPFWHGLFLLLAVVVTFYSAWSLARGRKRQDLYYLLLGLYLVAIQLPIAFPSLGSYLGMGQPVTESSIRFLLATPAVVLFVLGIRAR